MNPVQFVHSQQVDYLGDIVAAYHPYPYMVNVTVGFATKKEAEEWVESLGKETYLRLEKLQEENRRLERALLTARHDIDRIMDNIDEELHHNDG